MQESESDQFQFLCLLDYLTMKIYDIGLAGNVSGFLNFSKTVEKVLGTSMLILYKEDTNIFRATTKLWIWTLILS